MLVWMGRVVLVSSAAEAEAPPLGLVLEKAFVPWLEEDEWAHRPGCSG